MTILIVCSNLTSGHLKILFGVLNKNQKFIVGVNSVETGSLSLSFFMEILPIMNELKITRPFEDKALTFVYNINFYFITLYKSYIIGILPH